MAIVEPRQLGTTDLKLSLLGFGCAPVASRAGSGQSTRAIQLAFESGINYFDTADSYGMGGSEQTLGRVFRSQRDKVIISTKCGYLYSSRLKAIQWIKPLVRPIVKRLKGAKSAAASIVSSQKSQNFDPQYIEQSVHGSLRRLQTDYIDLFFLHDPPMAIGDRLDVFHHLHKLKDAGAIRHYGVSCDLDVAMRLARMPELGIAAFQININLLDQSPIDQLIPLLASTNVGLIARQPFAHGAIFNSIAADRHDVASHAIRFLLQFPQIASILPSMIKPEHLRANIAAVNRGSLSTQEQNSLRALLDRTKVRA